MLPQNVVERLGVRTRRTAIVTYADERKEERPIAGPLTTQWMCVFVYRVDDETEPAVRSNSPKSISHT